MSGMALAQTFYTIGTGGVTGVYYPVGGATAKIVNDANVGLRLTVESTAASVFNVKSIQNGSLDLGLAQSDVVYQAIHGQDAFDGSAYAGLRAVMGLHAEPMHLVCRGDAGVTQFSDLVGKRVSIGDPGSGTLNTVRGMLEAKGIEESSLRAEYLKAAEAPDFLRDGRLDCFFYAVGVGAAAIRDVTATTDATIVPLDDAEFQTLIDEFPYYAFATAPAGTYGGQDEDVTLFGVKALFVNGEDMPEEDVYKIVKAILDNMDAFHAIHPALATLTPADFLTGLGGAQLHPGAERAYTEAGLL
jgi:TRAP transporter TAXI family solute receptor